jgi:UDP-glucose:(heptosyl)LPS alpha-1,3-glucosyltransferase
VKIAIVRKKYIFHGGAEGFSQALITQLTAAGHEIHIYAVNWEGNPAANIFFHKVPVFSVNSFLRDLSFAISSFFLLKKTSYDIIQSHDKTLYQDIYRAGDGCHIEWLKQRWLRTGLSGKLSIVLNPYHWLILTLERIIFKGHRYRKILAISELVKRNIMEYYHVPSDDIIVIYNPVDLERFHIRNRERHRAEIRERHGIAKEDFVVLFVGSGFERKGVRYLIDAVESLDRPVTVLIVGKGNERQYKRLAKRQKVVFCGPQREVEVYYAASDIFVFPSMYEPFGNVHLEALASGLPVITTSNSGGAEIIQDGVQGFVVPVPEDVAGIACGIAKLFDHTVRENMGRDARTLAESFSYAEHAMEMDRIYLEVRRLTQAR